MPKIPMTDLPDGDMPKQSNEMNSVRPNWCDPHQRPEGSDLAQAFWICGQWLWLAWLPELGPLPRIFSKKSEAEKLSDQLTRKDQSPYNKWLHVSSDHVPSGFDIWCLADHGPVTVCASAEEAIRLLEEF